MSDRDYAYWDRERQQYGYEDDRGVWHQVERTENGAIDA